MEYSIRQTKDFSVNFGGFHLPKGAVYTKLEPRVNAHGVIMPAALVYVTDLAMVRNQGHYIAYILRADMNSPRRIYVDAISGVWFAIAEFIRNLGEVCPCVNPILNREVRACGPRDRKTPVYRTGKREKRKKTNLEKYGYSYSYIASKDATAGVQVGPVRLTTEGYYSSRLGVETY